MRAGNLKTTFDDTADYDDGNGGGPRLWTFSQTVLCTSSSTSEKEAVELSLRIAQEQLRLAYTKRDRISDPNVKLIYHGEDSTAEIILNCGMSFEKVMRNLRAALNPEAPVARRPIAPAAPTL